MMSDFAQFMQQPFVSAILPLLCFFTILLVAVIAALVYVRRRKAQRRAAPDFNPVMVDSADLPDLDTLVSNLPPAASPAPARVAAPSAAPVRPARTGTFTVTVQDGGSAEAVEVMTVLRDVVDGRLIVQMGDRVYRNINSDTEFKDRFTRLMRELAQVARPLGQPADQPPLESAPEPPAETPLAPPQAASPSAPRPAAPPPPPTGTLPGDLPTFRLEDQGPIKPTRGQKRELKPVPEINIAAAIEAYLQHKLTFLPDYNGRSIHIYPAPDGGVSIEVDGQFFDAVGDVTDTEVRSLLQTTIQEWQDRH
ncbi:MAG: hypothetical protein HZC41_18750 [Chloroflexi bacterium]|nr:hypothetical protein [Chloroflexota bacterium]